MGKGNGTSSRTDWKDVKSLLLDVLDVEPGNRTAFLDGQRIDAETRREIESLLGYERRSNEVFDSISGVGLSKDFFEGTDTIEEVDTVAGKFIGAYRLVSELGIGGMGAVYLAERTDGKFDQKVAIKFLKREFNAGKVRDSFRREIEIHSKLAHPNVATVFDAGTTDDGIPYVVMEYVAGSSIDKYCQGNDLSLLDLLKLFNKVCEAVSFAHQRLIVHRDLKPSNIIVTPEGIPKLLDFGISKLVGTLEKPSGLTMLGAMTPEYASPEQMRGEAVSTATDIFSLGVILFKLLTGTLPYDIKNKHNGDLIREITDTQPTLPSKSASVSPVRQIRPAQLAGDLDNIILKALRKEPEERYRTVEQFSEDIWRYIDGLPVNARASSFRYRAQKFLGRHRGVVAAAAIVALSLMAGIATSAWQANVARRQAGIAAEAQFAAETEAEKAKAEQAKSEKISRFMAKVISYANPAWYAEGSRFGGNARVIDVLEDLGDKIDQEFEGQPDIQAELHHKFGEVYSMVGKNNKFSEHISDIREKTIYHFLRALELRKQYYGERHELVAKDLFYSYSLIEKDPQGQASLLADAIQMMRETDPQNLNLPYMLEAYSAMLILPLYADYHEAYRRAVIPATNDNNYQVAERYLRESLPMFRFHYKEDNIAIISNECRLSYVLAMQDKWTDFDEHFTNCKFGSNMQQGGGVPEAQKREVDRVEKVLASKGRSN